MSRVEMSIFLQYFVSIMISSQLYPRVATTVRMMAIDARPQCDDIHRSMQHGIHESNSNNFTFDYARKATGLVSWMSSSEY